MHYMLMTVVSICRSLHKEATLLTAEIIKWQKCARMGLNGFHIKCIIGTHCSKKNQNPGSPLGATSWTALPIWQIWPIWAKFEVNGLDWQCCLAGSSQRAPRILVFSIAMGADYSFYVKTIETHARAFFKVIIFSIGSVYTHQNVNSTVGLQWKVGHP